MTSSSRAIAAYDVVRANAPYRAGLLAATEAVFNSGQVILGNRLTHFEEEFARYCGTSHCIGTGNGLDAIVLILRALDIAHGDEVIVPAFTFIATWLAASHVGAIPVPVDVTPDALLDPALLEAAITPRTRAILPVHLYGRLADMHAILSIAASHGIPVIEDAAQAHGAGPTGSRAGSRGTASAFSFYPAKNLGAVGDGGAVCTSNDALAASVRCLGNYGSDQKYRHETLGQNSRLDEIQAAYLSVKLPNLDAANERRRSIARRYLTELHGLPGLSLPQNCAESAWHQFVIRINQRSSFQQALTALGIGTIVHYPIAPFDQPCYAGHYDRSRFPVAAELAATVLSIPVADYLTEQEVTQIIEAVSSVATA